MLTSSNHNSSDPNRLLPRSLKEGLFYSLPLAWRWPTKYCTIHEFPLDQAVQALQTSFTGPIATGPAQLEIVTNRTPMPPHLHGEEFR